jgi:RecA-family ATPase
VSILPEHTPSAFEQSQAVALKLGNVYPDANFCTFSVQNAKKIPRKRDGSQGVARDTPADALFTTEDVWAMEAMPHGDYFGLVLQKAAAIPGKGHLVVLDVDLKHSQTTTNIAIQKMARWVKGNNALTEISVSGKGRHVFLLCTQADNILPKYKLAAGQEVEVFGLDNSAGKSVLLSGSQLTGEVIEVPDLHALLTEWGIIEQHTLNQPKASEPIDFSPLERKAPAIQPQAPDDIHKAANALQFISPDAEYQQWIEIGQALHTAFGNQGHALWSQWSAAGSKYKGQSDIDTHWKSFHQGKGIGLGTLFHTAKEHGWESPTKTTERKSAVEDFKTMIQSGSPDEPGSPTEPQGWPELSLDITSLKPIDYMIQGFWAHSFFVLAGQPGVGKTTAMISACMVMAGFQISDTTITAKNHRKTIFVTEDSDQITRTLFAYAKHFHIKPTDLLNWFVVIDAKRSDVKDLLTLAHNVIRHTVNGIRPHLVLDTANSTMAIDNENDNSEVGSYLAALKQTIFVQLHTPISILTHTNKTISRQDSDAMARGASAFTGDATLTGILFMDPDGTRYMKLTKTRYEPDFREIRFDTQLFPEIVLDAHGDPQTMLCRIAIPYPSAEETRKQIQADKQDDKRQQQITDAADAACNFVQSLINTHSKVIMRKGPGRPIVPKDLQDAHKLEWSEVYQAVPQADQSYARKAVGTAIFHRFGVDPNQSGWVQLI